MKFGGKRERERKDQGFVYFKLCDDCFSFISHFILLFCKHKHKIAT